MTAVRQRKRQRAHRRRRPVAPRLLAVAAAFAALVPMACQAPEPGVAAAPPSEAIPSMYRFPLWAAEPIGTSADGVYVTGVAAHDRLSGVDAADEAAERLAREGARDVVYASVAGAIARYGSRFDLPAEAIATQRERLLTSLHGTVIADHLQLLRRARTYDERSEHWLSFAQARLDFAEVAQAVEAVLQPWFVELAGPAASEEAAEFRRILFDERRRHQPTAPRYDPSVPQISRRPPTA